MGTRVNKFEEVSSDGHQMSLAGELSRTGPMSNAGGGRPMSDSFPYTIHFK